MAKYQVRGADIGAHLGRPPKRPRRPLAAGLVLAGLVGWIVLRSDMLRGKLTAQARALGCRISAARSGRADDEIGRDDPVAFTAAETMPIAAPAHPGEATTGTTGYPPGFGADTGRAVPSSEIGTAD